MDIFQYEKKYVKAGLEQLKPFLLSGDSLWNLGLPNVSGHSPYPQLSLGNLLLSQAKLAANSEIDAELEKLENKLDALRSEWTSRWQNKANEEYGKRLRQWSRFLDEFGASLDEHQAELSHNLRSRAIVQILSEQATEIRTDLHADLEIQDGRYRDLTLEGKFLWPAEIRRGFGEEKYWFLYRRARSH